MSDFISIPQRIRIVSTFEALMATPFGGDVNAVCWARDLEGNFQEVIDQLRPPEGVTTIDDADLLALTLTSAGTVARDVLLADQALLRSRGLAPILDCITGYPRDDAAGAVPTDVYSFHVDRATGEADTYLCTYVGLPSEGLANDAALRRIDEPHTRAQLLKDYAGNDDEGFAQYLSDHNFDLHFVPQPGAMPFSFGIGNFWRIAITYPGCPGLPCIHRAPLTLPGDAARLLLIS